MAIGAFTDKLRQPTDDEILRMIGPGWALWQELILFIREHYPVTEDLKFLYGEKYGWAMRFRVHGKLLTSLYPTDGGFTVQINLSQDAVERAMAMNPGKNVKEAVNRATPYPEGRWLFIRVESKDDIRDIQQLLPLRMTMQNPA